MLWEMPELGSMQCHCLSSRPTLQPSLRSRALQEMGADYYNTALCLRGAAPMEGSDWWPPACNLPF